MDGNVKASAMASYFESTAVAGGLAEAAARKELRQKGASAKAFLCILPTAGTQNEFPANVNLHELVYGVGKRRLD